jgi:hypothetical protein
MAGARRESEGNCFRTQLGLIVDKPKLGFGSSNDGNDARRFFANASTSSIITDVDEELINKFYVILQAISSGHELNITEFQTYTFETTKLCVPHATYMPTSVHKICIHGPQIIASALLPIGVMSEKAQEACNKCIQDFRQNFTRKFSRTATLTDLINRLLLTSHLYISNTYS